MSLDMLEQEQQQKAFLVQENYISLDYVQAIQHTIQSIYRYLGKI